MSRQRAEAEAAQAAEAAEAAEWRGVQLAVAPGGTVSRAPPPAPAPPPDADAYTCANDDEASFRPVVRASHALPPPADLPASCLPRTTTIPVQSLLGCRPRPLATDVVVPAALDDYDADLERQMSDATRDHPHSLPERPDISVAPRVITPTPVADSSSVKCSVSARARTPDRVRDAEPVAEMDSEEEPKKVVEDIPPIEASVKSKKKLPSSDAVAENSNVIIAPIEVSLNEFEDLKSFKKSSSLPKKETSSKKESRSKKETSASSKVESSPVPSKNESPDSLKRTQSPCKKESSVSSKKEPSPSPSKKELVATSKKEPSISIKKEPSPPKIESVLLPRRDLSPPLSKNESPVSSKRESSPSSSKKESRASSKKDSKKEPSPLLSKKDSLSTSKMETSPLPSKKESLSTSKKETSPIPSKKESSPLPSKKESSPTRSRKDSLSSSKKQSSQSPSRKEPLTSSQRESSPSLSFSEILSFKRESYDRESTPRKNSNETNTLWKKERNDWSIKSTETKTPCKKETAEIEVTAVEFNEVIKTEEQAWDMLLNQPEKPELSICPQSVSDKSDETKTKSKKNRKLKKAQEDSQSKSEDDSFVEIHAIEEKAQLSCGELVSISMPYEEIEPTSSYSCRTKKSRSPKNIGDKKEQQPETKLDEWSLDDIGSTCKQKSSKKKNDISDIDTLPELDSKVLSKERRWEVTDAMEIKSSDIAVVENVMVKEFLPEKKYKSNYESRKSIEKAMEAEVKDVYVIDSTNDEFPEIQITRGNKLRKKSLQTDSDDFEADKPIKSWSSIAASKNVKKEEKGFETKSDNSSRKRDVTEKRVIHSFDEYEDPSMHVSLHEELMRLCKRTDIMVAQCDTPSELSFFDEHHSLLQDLPPLELDFNLDDFKLEVMRDSLLEVNDPKVTSPICKIDIDNILSSIKESTSTFNLIDLKEVPAKKEKGFSVIESDKITSQEVKVDDDVKGDDKDVEVMEKSSDDDNASPVLSTDSDKEDKKSSGASNVTTPSSKQSNKSKKSRRKKK